MTDPTDPGALPAPRASAPARGEAAERLALALLVERGLVPIGRNWRRRLGEIDLVLRDPADGSVVFVEVRYRDRRDLGGGLGSIDAGKRRRMRRAALAWLQRHAAADAPARIDVVAVGTDAPDAEPAALATGRRVVVRRGGLWLEWVISAVEDDG